LVLNEWESINKVSRREGEEGIVKIVIKIVNKKVLRNQAMGLIF
jgi:hypothetical protein